jgi:hypothetical protein
LRFLLQPTDASTIEALRAAAARGAEAGLDGVLVTATEALPAPLVAASALAAVADDLLVAAEVPLGDRHPLEIAEEAAVVDQAARGRLLVVAAPAAGAEAAFEEALDVLRAAGAGRPFEAGGPRWPTPAHLPEHAGRHERRVRVTPPPFGSALALWIRGAPVRAALSRGLGHVSERDDDATVEQQWRDVRDPAPAVARARRESTTDGDELLARLQTGRETFGQDWAIVRGPAAEAAAAAGYARPRLQLDALPDALAEHWRI